jgi:farnesyl-diphosphate farnesyltransferase
MGARFDNTFSDTAKLFSSSAGSAGSPTSITGRDEL